MAWTVLSNRSVGVPPTAPTVASASYRRNVQGYDGVPPSLAMARLPSHLSEAIRIP
ncbi:MAG: hypothetical protein NZ843_04865 [Fimbriimonadales bacterium]|nr:hypothetical protein [Fimbriimonadales bacterium]